MPQGILFLDHMTRQDKIREQKDYCNERMKIIPRPKEATDGYSEYIFMQIRECLHLNSQMHSSLLQLIWRAELWALLVVKKLVIIQILFRFHLSFQWEFSV